MKMDAANLEKPIIMATGTRLHNQVSRCYKKPGKIILAKELNALFQILPRNIDATLLLDLSQFNDDVEHPAIKSIFKKGFGQRIIVFTSEQEQANLYKLFEQGARGFCHTTISDELLIKAIKAVEEGELWIGRKLIGYLMSKLVLDVARKRGAASGQTLNDSKLTLRESEVISCVAKGKCDKVIALELDISPNTVKNHLSHIFAKLQIADRFQLALIYHGIEVK
jgi:DNA-binding NarL/FixJ family response regulator